MSLAVRIQLSVMMFLQYAIWGSWGVTMATYLGKTLNFQGIEIGWVYNTSQIGAILAPLLIGIIADRLFATQTVLSVCHLAGSGLLVAAAEAKEPRDVFLIMLGFALLYMPTLALTNSISFRNMGDPDRDFPTVRVLGTIGWIAAGLTVGMFNIGETNKILYLSAGLSASLGIFSVFLPHTPPLPMKSGESRGVLAAFRMFADPSFAILMLISFGISIALAFYYQLANPFLVDLKLENSAAWQTLGQWSEIIFMLALPLIVKTLGIRWTLMLGMLAWCVRYGIFYTQYLPLVVGIGLPLHGICYDFFFVVSQLFVDSKAPRELRASAQGLLTLVTLGLGMFVGNILAGYTKDLNTLAKATEQPVPVGSLAEAFLPSFLWKSTEANGVSLETVTQWPGVWAPAAIGCGIATVLFFISFRPRTERA